MINGIALQNICIYRLILQRWETNKISHPLISITLHLNRTVQLDRNLDNLLYHLTRSSDYISMLHRAALSGHRNQCFHV